MKTKPNIRPKLTSLIFLAAAAIASAQDKPIAITGTMEMTYNTRRADKIERIDEKTGAIVNKPGVADVYKADLLFNNKVRFNGMIRRTPNLASKWFGNSKQEGQLYYQLTFSFLNPNNPGNEVAVGKWVGTVPMTPDGRYILGGQPDAKHRIVIDSIGQATGFEEQFDGTIYGKSLGKQGTVFTFVREIKTATGMQKKELKVDNVDPMRFENLVLAKGPAPAYPRTTVNGELNFDRETGNYLTNGIRFVYTVGGQQKEDVYTGTIKWIEDANYSTTGKGRYQFNVRLNEHMNKPATDESAAFAAADDESAFFAVNTSVPAITGDIVYEGQMGRVGDKSMPTVDKATYNLACNGMTAVQAMNFWKLWLICVSPTNDE